MWRAAAIFGENYPIGGQGPFRLLRCQHTVAGAIGIIRARHCGDRPYQGDLPVAVAAIKFGKDGVILIEVSFYAAASMAGDQGPVQPLIGMEQHRHHAIGVGPIENLFIHFGYKLAGMNLANIGNPRYPLTTGSCRTRGIVHLRRGRCLANGSTGQVHRGFD